MAVAIHLHRDASGYPRVTVDPSLEALASFLEQDVQSSVNSSNELLSLIGRAERDGTTWQGTGNAFTLTIRADGALLQCEFDEELSCCLPLADLHSALLAWRSFIQSNEQSNVA
jgi:uncharacterized protein YacL (UPF0231 family)